MNRYKSKKNILLLIDILAICLSYAISLVIRYYFLVDTLGSKLVISESAFFFACALIVYVGVSLIRRKTPIEKMSFREIAVSTFESQVVFIAAYIFMFFLMHRDEAISRIVLVLFFALNVILVSGGRILYHHYCIRKSGDMMPRTAKEDAPQNRENPDFVRHVYIIGSKSVGLYGGFESFVMNLLQQHKDNKSIKYHVACKANGEGYMDLTKLEGHTSINDHEFSYCNAHCFLVTVPAKLGPAQAIFYDIRALEWCCEHIEKNHIEEPIVYILASRIGPFEKRFVDRIHDAGGKVYQNPDGHEDWRAKWSPMIRRYWKFSEGLAVKYADLVVCDSKSIESYIQEEYSQYQPNTTYIAYGSYIKPSALADDDPKYVNWLTEHNLKDKNFYTVVGRCVPENNFETIIREFMLSHSTRDLAIITTNNTKMLNELEQKLHYRKDKRIKFVGTVYDTELLPKIRENSCGYFHGHSVGGTNPSLLEALGATKVNLLLDVGFNREVAEEAALYWNKEEGNLAALIDRADRLDGEAIEAFGQKAKARIQEAYSWEFIAGRYEEEFLK